MHLPSAEESNFWYHDNDSDLVIVFLHGFQSNCRDCWVRRTGSTVVYWPDLALRDSRLGAPSVFMAGYYTRPAGGLYGVRDCAEEVYRALTHKPASGRSVLDRPQILFVGHSAGGVVARYLLESRSDDFVGKSVFLLLLSSPSLGSRTANVLWPLLAVVRSQLGQELQVVSPVLADLDARFRELLKRKAIPGLSGAELVEHPPIYKFTIVSRFSAGRYFGNPIPVPGEDHQSVAKPTSRTHLSHRQLLAGVLHLKPAQPAVHQPTNFFELVRRLCENHGFVWERGTFPAVSAGTLVYWPVRLRYPTLIHAAQAFSAALLQRQGCTVVLALDDLGTSKYSPDRCIDRLRRWFERGGGDASQLNVRSFTSMIGGDMNHHEPLQWTMVEKWLGNTEYRLERVLPVCKLLQGDLESDRIDDLLAKRPRRLLTPPMVWAVLAFIVRDQQPSAVVTLSGFDERPLWQAWRECSGGIPAVPAGHLYLPDLTSQDKLGPDRPVHMRSNRLAWESSQDIRNALRAELERSQGDPLQENRLLWWAFQMCIHLPVAMGVVNDSVVIRGERIDNINDAPQVDPEILVDALALALDKVLL